MTENEASRPDSDLITVGVGMLGEARSEVSHADSKASLVLAVLGIGFGAVFGGLLAGDWSPTRLVGLGEVIWWLAAICAVVSVAFSASAVWPRYDRRDIGDGISYWGHVSTYPSLSDFQGNFSAVRSSYVDRTIHQLWHLSRLVHRKYFLVRLSNSLAGVSILLFGVATLVSSILEDS